MGMASVTHQIAIQRVHARAAFEVADMPPKGPEKKSSMNIQGPRIMNVVLFTELN